MGFMKEQSETWEPPQFWKKRSRSEKAILGATLGIPGYSRSNSRNDAHDLIYVNTLFSEQLSERLSELVGRQSFSSNSQRFFFKIGVVPARQKQRKDNFEGNSFSNLAAQSHLTHTGCFLGLGTKQNLLEKLVRPK